MLRDQDHCVRGGPQQREDALSESGCVFGVAQGIEGDEPLGKLALGWLLPRVGISSKEKEEWQKKNPLLTARQQ